MQLLELRTKLETLLAEDLGRFNNGEIAIWVEPPMIPPHLKTGGIQLVIRGVPTGDSVPMSAGQTLFDRVWTIDLVNFDRSKSLAIVLDKLRRSFVFKREPIYRQPSSSTLESATVYIYRPIALNPFA